MNYIKVRYTHSVNDCYSGKCFLTQYYCLELFSELFSKIECDWSNVIGKIQAAIRKVILTL